MRYPLLEVDPSVTENTSLYRTLDFFGAAQIVEQGQLMFSRGDVFSDPNEGVDALLAQLEIVMPGSGCGMGWSDRESAKGYH